MKAKKLTALLMTLAMTGTLLAGCGQSSTTADTAETKEETATEETAAEETASADTEETVNEEIRVVTYFAGSDAYAPVWKEVCNDYMADHPGITIVDESQPTSGSNDQETLPIWFCTTQEKLIPRHLKTPVYLWNSVIS